MGTTQRINPGVTGQPNWRGLNVSATNIAKTVEIEKQNEENKEVDNKTPEQQAKEYQRLLMRRNNNLSSLFNYLVKTGGGTKNITTGKSRSIGKAGIKTSSKLTHFIADVGSNGLQQTLQTNGFGNLEGKTTLDIINFLVIYCSDVATGMDETAANKASLEVLSKIAEESSNDIDKFEQILSEYAEGGGMSNLVCEFWGYYIFEHLSQRFQERITQQKGEEVSSETFTIIKDDIIGRVKVLNEKRAVSNINWKGAEGEKIRETIFVEIINIICNGKNN